MPLGRFRYSLQAHMQPSTAGGPPSLHTLIYNGRDFFRQIICDPLGGWPLTALNSAVIIGVDYPFPNLRYDTGTELPPRKSYYAKSLGVKMAGEATLLGIPFTILEAPPTDEPVFHGKLLDPLTYLFSKKIKQKSQMASRATVDAAGRWIEALPSTTYLSDSCHILGEIQRHLLVPEDGGLTWDMWQTSEVLSYLNERLTRFISLTGVLRKRYTATISDKKVDLPSDSLGVRRVAFNGRALDLTDTLSLDLGKPGWQILSGTPTRYIEEPLEVLTIQLVPMPSTSGTIDIIYVPKPSPLTSICEKMPIPNFMSLYVKYGVMADMLKKDGPANEPERASYCEDRFTEGIEMTKLLMGSAT